MTRIAHRKESPAGGLRMAALTAMAMWAAGCDRQEGPRAIHETEIKSGMAGGGMPMDAVHGFSGGAPMGMPQGETPQIEFDAPEGWDYRPGSGMRLATFKIKDGAGEKEATLVVLPGAGDEFAPNVRRWLGQLGLELPEDRLERFVAGRDSFTTVQGLPGAFFDFTRLKDVPDGGKGSMLASMIDMGGQALFVKLTGDAAFLGRNKAKFLALSKSIRLNEGAGEEPPARADADSPAGRVPEGPAGGGMGAAAGGGMGQGMGQGMGTGMGGMTMQSNDPAFNQVPNGVARLTWETPPGWKSLGAKGMRTGSFAVSHEGKTADGSIVQLPGPAGGIESNVRRWMEQAGLSQLDDKAMQAFLQSQKRIRTRNGYDGILVDLASQLNGNMMQENSILAVMIQAPDETIFVKLTGPRAVLLRNVDALARLASSLATAD